ncbi:uncharacterized protein METZ01_LOCUS506129, partial [marine metagenome]
VQLIPKYNYIYLVYIEKILFKEGEGVGFRACFIVSN